MGLVPLDEVDVWNKFVKPVPVEAVPWLVIVEEKVCAVPAVAVAGVGVEAMRSGRGIAVKVAVTVQLLLIAPVV